MADDQAPRTGLPGRSTTGLPGRSTRPARRETAKPSGDNQDRKSANTPRVGDSRPDSRAPRVGDSRPDSRAPRVGDSRPDSRASRVGDSRPDSRAPRVGDSRPDSRAPRVGDSRPDSRAPKVGDTKAGSDPNSSPKGGRRRRRGGRGRGRRRGGAEEGKVKQEGHAPVEAITGGKAVKLDENTLKRRRGRTRRGQAVGRYLMCVHVGPEATQIATLEGRKLVEHRVSRPADDVSQIHGNIYLGRVQSVLPGMEAAFIDIGTPKNAVLYRGDVQYDATDFEGSRIEQPRIEDILKSQQSIMCQVTKNPIGHKGARLGQEVSLPGRFVVLVPNSGTYGISKRLPGGERQRLRNLLDKAKPQQHGVIVRTAAENVTEAEIRGDLQRLMEQWDGIEKLAKRTRAPALLYREPEVAVRTIREEVTRDYRGVIIDDKSLYSEIRSYVQSITPEIADRIIYYDAGSEALPLFERRLIDTQVRKALEPKVWLPSGGSLVIEHTEALTVIDVNTGKNVGSSNLEETVFKNNLEAAEEVAYQLRLRDIGGIIVIDFVDMEVAKNREAVTKAFRTALARDKTRTQMFNISELGLVEMTRKRIGEGLIESVSEPCSNCEGTGHRVIEDLFV